MNPALVKTQKLGKAFRLYNRPGDRAIEWLTLGQTHRHSLQWALKDIDLEVHQGECVGLIGPNGAGKSTLLRILSRTLLPTTGTFTVAGQLVSLLELGTGFNLELTGRQNILHTAELLGFPSEYAKSRMPDIEAFADIDWHMDRPARTYSSGMLLRVAFAMFAFLEPNVLIIDEALAVGDAAFQRKCYRQIEKMLADPQRAVILVSHDLQSIVKLCHRVYWLDHGCIRLSGNPQQVVQEYLREMFSDPATRSELPAMTARLDDGNILPVTANCISTATFPESGLLSRSSAATLYPPRGVHILGLWIEDDRGETAATVAVDRPFAICYAVQADCPIDQPVLGIRVNTTRGDCLVATNTLLCERRCEPLTPGHRIVVKWPVSAGLAVGDYFISCGCSLESDVHHFLMREVDAYQFSVVGPSRQRGLCSLNQPPIISHLTDGPSPRTPVEPAVR